jgi:hypothetical protein
MSITDRMQNGYVAKDLNLLSVGQFSPAIPEHLQHDAIFSGAWTLEVGMHRSQIHCHI